jgi:uncharacterized protein YbjT (DUF2867 family)
MIVVTGANGHLGRAVIEHLLQLVPATSIRASTRAPEQLHDLAAHGVQVRHGDFSKPDELRETFAGTERLLLISADVIGPDRVDLHRNAIDVAREAGVGHVFYTSIIEPDPQSPFTAAADHYQTEAYLRESGLRYTFLRNGLYAELVPGLIGAALQGQPVQAPADGPIAYVARSDLAEATARVLASGGHINEALNLTGPEALDLAQLTAITGTLTGRTVERQIVTADVYRAQLINHGLPESVVDTFLGVYVASRQGRFTLVDPVLEQLLARPRQTVAQVLQQVLSAQPA